MAEIDISNRRVDSGQISAIDPYRQNIFDILLK
ncbi:UNVERIFIED_ORG: hypothetical protein GGD47_002515 [Rhizobium etli]